MYGFTFNMQRFATGVSLNNTNNDTLVTGTAGNDTIDNTGSNVTINAGDDSIRLSSASGSNNVIVYNSGDGNDTLYGLNSKATLQIATGGLKSVTSNDGMDMLLHVGDDTITIRDGWRYFDTIAPSPSGKLAVVDANGHDLLATVTPVRFAKISDGYGSPYPNSTSNVSLVGTDDNDYLDNTGSNVTIDAGAGNDTINNSGSGTNVTINAGAGNDQISLVSSYGSSTTSNVIVYNSGDGNDTVTGFDANSTLQIGGTYFTQESGSDIIVTVGDGSILLKGAASLSAVNITGKEIPAPSDWTITDGVASYKDLFTITGLKAGVTVDDIKANVSIGGSTVTVNEKVLGDTNVTISEDYTLALARTVKLSEEIPAKWNVSGSTATYTGEHFTEGYAVVESTIIHHEATEGATFTLTGIKRNLTEADLADNVTIEGETVTLGKNVLNAGNVTISDGWTLALGDDVPKSDEVSANWDINAAGDTSTAIYTAGGSTEGYALDDNKIIYNSATGDTFTLTGLSKNFTADDVSIEGNKVILSADALGKSNVTLITTGNYALKLGDDCPTVGKVDKSWTLDGTTATYHDAGKSDGYKLTNSKTVTYTPAVVGKALLTVEGLADGLTVDEGAIDGLSIDGKVLTVTPDVVGSNFSVGGGYKVVFDEGEYAWAKFTGTTGRDTVEVNGNGLQIDGGKGNDTVTANVSGNVYLFDTNGGADVIKGFGDDDTIKITDGAKATASVKSKDIIVKAGSATMTLKDAAKNGTHLNVVDAAGETLIDETFYTDRIVKDDGATLLPAFNSTSFATDDTIVKVDGSATTKKFSLSGGDDDNTLIGGTGSNFINGGDGENQLTGGRGNDTFVAGGGTDTITDYGVGTDKISLAADIESFSISGSDVVLNFDDGKSMTIADGAGKKINFLQNGKASTEIFTSGGKTNANGTSITLNAATTAYAATSTIMTIDGGLTGGVHIVGNAKANKIFGGSGDDTLNGNDSDNVLIGGRGNNLINGGAGSDILIGNGGANTFVYSSGNDTISDYEAKDRISLTSAFESFDLSGDDVIIGFGSSSLTIADAANSSVTFVETVNGKVTTSVNVFASEGIFNKAKTAVTLNADTSNYMASTSMLTIDGGLATGAIEIVGNAKANKIFGGSGDDTFIYSSGGDNDVIYNFDDEDALQISGTFNASVVGENVTFKVGSTANAITLKDYSATTFNVNGDTYQISEGSFTKK